MLPRILIIGTQSKHKNRLTRKFSGRAELRFFDDKTGSAGLISRTHDKDFIVFNTQLGRHSHMYIMRESGVAFTMTAGAISAIEREIEKFLETHHGEEAQAA